MEVMDIPVIRDVVPELDTTWFDFCHLFNASNVFPAKFEEFDGQF